MPGRKRQSERGGIKIRLCFNYVVHGSIGWRSGKRLICDLLVVITGDDLDEDEFHQMHAFHQRIREGRKVKQRGKRINSLHYMEENCTGLA